MSYIRCLSNPEGLYIYGSSRGKIEIATGNCEVCSIPRHIFNGIMLRWLNSRSNVSYRGAHLEEVHIERLDSNGKKIPLDDFWAKLSGGEGDVFERIYQWRLTYKGWSVYMWEVTLFYIASNVQSRIEELILKKYKVF